MAIKIKIPNYSSMDKVRVMNKGNKITSQERINFDKNVTNYGGKIGAEMRKNAPDRDKIMVGNIPLSGYKKGGKIDKTKTALVHKGEVVIPKKIVKNKTYAQVKNSIKKTMGKK